MNLSETTQALAVLGPIFGVLSVILGFVVWVLKSHIQSKNEQISQLKLDKQSLVADAATSEADARAARVERDAARNELVQLRANVQPLSDQIEATRVQYRHAADVARANYRAWQAVRARRDEAEKLATQLNAELTEARAGLASMDVRRAAAEAAAVEEREARAKAETKHDKAHKRAGRATKKVKELQKQINGVIKQDGRVWRKPIPAGVAPFVPLEKRKTRIISVFNLKGGVGKTTITANLAGYLGRMTTNRVMVIDVDHQRSLSQMFLSNPDRKSAAAGGRTLQHYLTAHSRDGSALLAAATEIPGLKNARILTNVDPLPGYGIEQSLDDLEMQLMGDWLVNPASPDVRFLMRQALHSEVVRQELGYVFIDCPPRLTTACINALTASDFVLIPIQPEAVSLRSVQHLLLRLKELQESGVLAHLQVLGLVANMVTPRAVAAAANESKLLSTAAAGAQNIWNQPVVLFDTVLTRGYQYAEASRELADGKPLKLAVDYPSIRSQYKALLSEIEDRIDESLGVAGVHS